MTTTTTTTTNLLVVVVLQLALFPSVFASLLQTGFYLVLVLRTNVHADEQVLVVVELEQVLVAVVQLEQFPLHVHQDLKMK